MSSDPGLDAKEHVVKKVLKFTKKGVEEKKRKNLPSKKRVRLFVASCIKLKPHMRNLILIDLLEHRFEH